MAHRYSDGNEGASPLRRHGRFSRRWLCTRRYRQCRTQPRPPCHTAVAALRRAARVVCREVAAAAARRVTPATPPSSPLGKTLDDMRREDDELRREHTPDEALSRGGTRPAAPAPGAAPGRSRCPAWQAGPVGGCSRALPRARGGVGRRRSCVASCRVSRTLGDEPVVLGPIAHGTPPHRHRPPEYAVTGADGCQRTRTRPPTDRARPVRR